MWICYLSKQNKNSSSQKAKSEVAFLLAIIAQANFASQIATILVDQIAKLLFFASRINQKQEKQTKAV